MFVFKRSGVRFVWAAPQGTPIVSMIHHEGRILVATTDTLYEVKREWPGWVVRALKFLHLG